MTIKKWSGFSKRKNSTKQPTGGTSVTAFLKEGTSIENPTFTLSGNNFTIDYVEAFGHYYFVKDIVSVRNNLIEIECVQDVLATYKSAITGSSQYVERANISGVIPRIMDPLNPPTDDIEVKVTDVLNLSWGNQTSLIVGVAGQYGVRYYYFTQAMFDDFMEYLFDDNYLTQFTSQFYGYRDCILSCRKVPYTPVGTSGNIYIGSKVLPDGNGQPMTGTIISETIIHDTATVLINFPSDDHVAGTSYFDFDPYSTMGVYLPYVGVVPVDVDIIGDTRYLTVDMWLDQITADIAYKLSTDGKVIGTFSGNCSAQLPIATQNYNAFGVTGGVLATIGGIASKNIGVAAGGIAAIVKSAQLHSQINGVLSSFIGDSLGRVVQACVVTKVPTDWDPHVNNARCGQPVHKTMALSGLSGYVKCLNASVDSIGFDEDRSAVEEFLNAGLYIE